ncbi:hypothetical protein BFN03_00815 [Rhodococcus sp. WMMA185]|nr:hypothetical protein BFN03_00815 [Rhodococcus sp. WMMA185]
MTKQRFRVLNAACTALAILCVMLPIMLQGRFSSGILGWSLALIVLAIWFSAAVVMWRKQNMPR